MKKLFAFIIFLTFANANGQDINLANKYVTPGILNPALAGIGNRPVVGLTEEFVKYNYNLVSYAKLYTNYTAQGFEINPSKNIGIGLYTQQTYDFGLIKTKSVVLSSSFRKEIGKDWVIRGGMRIGYSNGKANPNDCTYLVVKWPYYYQSITSGLGIFGNYKNMYFQIASPTLGQTLIAENLSKTKYSYYNYYWKGANSYFGLGGYISLSKQKEMLLHLSARVPFGRTPGFHPFVGNIDLIRGPWLFGIEDISIGGYDFIERIKFVAGYNNKNFRIALNAGKRYQLAPQFGLSFAYRFSKHSYRSSDAFEEKFNKLF